MSQNTNHRIDFVRALLASDNSRILAMNLYSVPAGMTSIRYLGKHPKYSIPNIPQGHVAIFSRWNPAENDYVIWKVA